MTLSQAMSICHRNKIIAYGVNKKGKLFVDYLSPLKQQRLRKKFEKLEKQQASA